MIHRVNSLISCRASDSSALLRSGVLLITISDIMNMINIIKVITTNKIEVSMDNQACSDSSALLRSGVLLITFIVISYIELIGVAWGCSDSSALPRFSVGLIAIMVIRFI